MMHFCVPKIAFAWLLLSATIFVAESFATPSLAVQRKVPPLFSAVQEDIDTDLKPGLIPRDRYVATNRFSVRADQQAKFEKRWATRKSRLATLDGFKYFHLMRRVNLEQDDVNTYDEGTDNDSVFGNYVSFTIWEKKANFQEWRTGEAFKEAHGGTSIGAFLSTMINSAFVLLGPPRPAFYDGILVQSVVPNSVPDTVNGWREVEADGVSTLPAECFVACNQFFVPSTNAAAFEERWASRDSKLKDCDGFVAFAMLRRDVGGAELSNGEPSYVSTTIWRDRAAFEGWRNGQAFKQVHGGPKEEHERREPKQRPAPLWSQPPQPVFYEATLVISSKDGA